MLRKLRKGFENLALEKFNEFHKSILHEILHVKKYELIWTYFIKSKNYFCLQVLNTYDFRKSDFVMEKTDPAILILFLGLLDYDSLFMTES